MNPQYRWILAPVPLMSAVLYAMYQGGSLAWHLLGFMLVLAVLAVAGQFGPLSKVALARSIRPGPYQAGEALNVTLTVTAHRFWLWPYLLLVDRLPNGLGVSDPRFVLNYVGRSPVTLQYQVPALKRGVYELNTVTLTTGDFFGLFQRSFDAASPTSLTVWPETVSLAGSRLFARIWHGENLANHSARQDSSHLRSIREYVRGDRLSHVHWKTSAHTGEFKVKQFEPDTKPKFTVVLDRASHFTESHWELAVSVTASLIQHAYHSQETIGLIATDNADATFPPTAGSGALTAMMNFLSELPYVTTSGQNTAALAWPGTRLVVVTDTHHVKVWRSSADVIVGVGPGGVEKLEDLARYLLPGSSKASGIR